ncbi:MAG TPA: class I SAM-dependent methyltransferase [Pyrinomonadaceae bacterium]|nr:class I SAM-dependent methyltransferase [Pyrinomonadaceae bacterium]
MSRTRQTLETIRRDFDRVALASDERWNHNAHYHSQLLARIPERCGQALEIGCGTGGFARLLAGRAERVLAIDLSPQMIRLARERSRPYANIDFVEGDAMARQFPEGRFDCVATLTTLHHMPFEAALTKVRNILKPGGTFVCLDLYRRSTLTDLLYDCVAYPTAMILRTIKTGRPKPPRDVRAAYAEHEKTDTYLTLSQVKQTCADILPGALVRRHLFWRYSIVWRKETAG